MKRIFLLLAPVLVLVTVLAAQYSGKILLDDLLLQEYIHPVYSEVLSTEQSEIWYYPKSEKRSSLIRNYWLNAGRSGHYSGLNVRILSDGSIELDGKNEGEGFSICCSPSVVSLGNGSYYLGTTEESPAFEQGYLYIEGWKLDPDGTKKKLMAIDETGRHEFTANSGEYDTYWYGLVIPEGFSADHLVITPLLLRTDEMETDADQEEADTLFAAVQYPDDKKDLASFALFHMNREALLKAQEADMKLFRNNLKYIYRERYACKWCSFVFPDGTGIEWNPRNFDECVYGEVDAFGKVYRKYRSGSWQMIFQ